MPFQKGQPKIAGRKKGVPNRATRIREKLGIRTWDQMGNFLENEGSKKCSQELLKLEGKDFVNAFASLSEFFKPKLSRTEQAGSITMLNVDLTPEEQRKIAQNLQRDY